MKIIITGGKGLVASNILPVLSTRHELIISDVDTLPEGTNGYPPAGVTAIVEWDITDKKSGEKIIREFRPDAVINLAAATDVDGCEDNVERAERINSEAPGVLADICEKYHIKLLHLSTDYVFDGVKDTPYNEEDRPNPRSVYGMTKLAGEMHVLENNPSALVVRAQWVYGKGGENFITKILKSAKDKGVVQVVDDQRGSPTFAKDLADPLTALITNDKSGIYHIANSGACTWFEFAREVFSQLGMDVQVEPITSTQLGRKAKRPSYSVYDCSKLLRDTGLAMRRWQEALRDYLGK